jgi:hypothetical protein
MAPRGVNVTNPEPADDFVDVGPPLSPADAGFLEFELGRRGLAARVRLCRREDSRDRQAVQVAAKDLAAALAARGELLPPAPPPPPSRPRSGRAARLGAATFAAVLGTVAALRVLRLTRIPRGPVTAAVVAGVIVVAFVAAFALGREPPSGGPTP